METKKPIPAFLPGQDCSIFLRCHPAWCISAPTYAYVSYADLDHGVSLRLPYSRRDSALFPVALGSPFGLVCPPQFHHLRLSLGAGTRLTYSSSSVWGYYSTLLKVCQGGWGDFLREFWGGDYGVNCCLPAVPAANAGDVQPMRMSYRDRMLRR